MNYPQILKDINIFVDGLGHLGTSKEIKLPVIKQKKQSLTAGGFEQDYETGTFEKLEAEFTLNEYSPIVLAAMPIGEKTGLGVNITVKASIYQGGKKLGAVASLQGNIEFDDGAWSSNKEVERKVKMNVNKYILEIDGNQGLLFDTRNMIAIIDGVDYLAELRSQIM